MASILKVICRNVLSRVAAHVIDHIEELLPWNLAALPICRDG
jgi:hypothetical protein